MTVTLDNSLYQKLRIVQGRINSISKTGYNSFQSYKYVVLKDILDELKPVLSSVNLHLTATTYDAVISETDAKVTVEVTVTNVDFPSEQLATAATGYAKDKGDKAIYKATTGAFKYALLLLFGLAQEDDDPEHDEQKGVTSGKKTKTVKNDFDDLDI